MLHLWNMSNHIYIKKQEEKSNEGNLFEILLRKRIQKNRK